MNRLKLLTLFTALTLATAASAQTTDESQTATLQSSLDNLALRLDAVEKKTSGWDKLLANLPQISGYGIMGYEWSNGPGQVSTSAFSVMSVRLSLAGDIGRKVDYKFQFEFMTPKLIDAYVRYKICPGFSLQAGQFHTNFSLEGPMSPLDMEAIDYAPIVKAVACQSPDTRDIGVAAYGVLLPFENWNNRRWNIIEYCVGVYNGEGKNKADANKSKDVVARLKINPAEHLTLSGSFGYGERGETYIHNTRYAAGAWWHGERFYLRSEYLGLEQNDAGVKNRIEGCYAVAGLWIKRFCPMVRYNHMTNCLGGTTARQTDWLAGLEYKPLKYLRLQANYTRTHYNGHGNADIIGIAISGIF